jgi:hypothetical protein
MRLEYRGKVIGEGLRFYQHWFLPMFLVASEVV